MVMDPTCGIGDLLLAYAELLHLATTLETTLDTWSHQIAGIERRPDLVSMTKARLVALARFRGHFNTHLERVDTVFPHIVVGDMFSEAHRSEEHKSDLQTQMRHSYDDFCWKK